MKNNMTTRRPLELLHMDLFGPNAYKSLGGNSFGLVIVDDFSRFTWVFFLDDKSQVQKIFKNFARKAQNQVEVKIKKVRNHNRTEFRTQMWIPFLTKKGFHTSSRLCTHLNKMELLRGRTGLLLRWRERCLMSKRQQGNSGLKPLIQHAMSSTVFIFTSF